VNASRRELLKLVALAVMCAVIFYYAVIGLCVMHAPLFGYSVTIVR